MDLPFLKKAKDIPAIRQYLFAVEISPGVVKSAIWAVINERTQVLAVGQPVNWDDKTSDSLTDAIDQTLTEATNRLDPAGKTSLDQVVLGLSATWIHNDKIVPDKLKLLKEVSSKLALKLVGFVVTPEAVIKYIQHTENVPPTAILLGFWPHHLELTLVKLGKVIGIQLVNRSADVALDVVEGLSRFAHLDMLPSRMLLYDSGLDLEEIKQLLLAYSWQSSGKKLPFLHFPKIEILAPDYTVRSIALAGGSEVARAIGLIANDEAPVAVPVEAVSVEPVSSQELGFISDQEAEVVSGLVMQPQVQFQTEPSPVTVTSRPDMPKVTLPKFKFHLPHLSFKSPKLLLLIPVILLLLAAIAGGYWFLPRAVVSISVEPKVLQQEFELIADTQSDSVQDSSIPATAQEVSVSDEKSVPTTGTKLIGEKATGTVVILNTTESPRKLAQGTTLTSPSGLKFVLNEEITVASASGSVFNPQPGKADAKITASQIGGDYNLSAGTEFRVGNLAVTQVAAKNEQAISGGSSQQVKAVAAADITKLRSEVSNQLKEQAREQLMQQATDGQTIIAESITLEIETEDFSAKLDDAADNLTLKSVVKARGLVINESDLQKLVSLEIQPLVPEGYNSISSQSHTFKVNDSSDDQVSFAVNVTAQLLPELNINEIANNISGKYPDYARDYISSLPAVSQIDISITPNLPSFLATLPRVVKNIDIVIRPN
jgi:hypothetical protein